MRPDLALAITQFVSTIIAVGCTVVYFLAAAFLLPETKGKTLEEIDAHFAGIRQRPVGAIG